MPVDFSNASQPFSVIPVDPFSSASRPFHHNTFFPVSRVFVFHRLRVSRSVTCQRLTVAAWRSAASRSQIYERPNCPPKGLYILTYRAWLETVILLPRHRRTVVQNMNRDGSTGPLARLFTPFTWTAHFFACFAMLTLLAHSLPCSWESEGFDVSALGCSEP